MRVTSTKACCKESLLIRLHVGYLPSMPSHGMCSYPVCGAYDETDETENGSCICLMHACIGAFHSLQQTAPRGLCSRAGDILKTYVRCIVVQSSRIRSLCSCSSFPPAFTHWQIDIDSCQQQLAFVLALHLQAVICECDQHSTCLDVHCVEANI